MISLSQVEQFGNIQNCYDKSTSTFCCTVCGDLLPSVLSYHNHNTSKHTCHELSVAIIKLFGLQLGQKWELKEKITDSIFGFDSLYYRNNNELKKELNLAVQKDSSIEEICQDTEIIEDNLTNTSRSETEKEIYTGSFKDNEEPAAKSGQYIIKDSAIETGKYNINKKENRLRIKERKSISKSTNVGSDLYEYYKVPSKEIKLEKDILRGNKGLNICDYLVAEEVFLQPHDYTEETVSADSVTKEASVIQADDSLHSLILDENYIQVNSNNTFSEYDHPQMMDQSKDISENDYEFIPVSGSEMEGNDDINLLAHSPVREDFPTSDSISLASLIYLILQNSVEGLPVSVIDTLLQSLFPYFFKNLSYSYVKCDMLELIRKTLRKERGFKRSRVKGTAFNDPVWEITRSISRYEEEIQNSSNLYDFTQSPALLKALKTREVKIDINDHGLPTISYSSIQQCSFQEGNGENIPFKQEYNVHSERNDRSFCNQDSNQMENMLMNNNSELLIDLNHIKPDLKGNIQNRFAKIGTENAQTGDVSTPKRKRFKNEKESQNDFLEKENCVLDFENSNEWQEIQNIHVKSEPLIRDLRVQEWDERNQESDQKGQELDNYDQHLIYEDVDINNYIYNGEKIYDIDTETLNISSECNQSIIENETNLVLDNNKELEGSKKKFLPQNIFEQNCTSETLQQRIPCNVLYEQTVSIEERESQAETNLCYTGVYNQDQEETSDCYNGVYHKDLEPSQQSKKPKRTRIPRKEKDMNKLKMSLDKETDNRNTTKKKQQQRRKQSSSKSNSLIRNLTTHRISEKIRRKELNEQFDHLIKRFPEYGLGKSLPKIAVLIKSRKYISKLKNTNVKLLIEKERLEEYQQTLVSRLNKLE